MTQRIALALAVSASLAIFAVLAAPAVQAGDVQGDAYDCQELWQMRNAIYKSGGYCFKSPKTIATFGNAGCIYESQAEVPISDIDRDTLAQIRKSEKRQAC
ncbi:MAG: YARHG domain-containing protein [Hyphomicrobium sp.]